MGMMTHLYYIGCREDPPLETALAISDDYYYFEGSLMELSYQVISIQILQGIG